MNPQIAIFACLIFYVFLLKMDRHGSSEISTALWIPTLWMMIIGSRMVSQWMMLGGPDISVDTYSEGSPIDRAIFSILFLCALVVAAKRGMLSFALIRENPWLFLLITYSAISITWSDFPIVSFKRYIKEIGNVLIALIVLSERNAVKAIETLTRRCAYLLIPLSIVLYKYVPDLGRGYGRWSGELFVTGVTNNKNSLGALCLVCAFLLSWSLLARWRNERATLLDRKNMVRASLLALTIWVLLLARSSTSTGCLLIGCLVLFTTLSEQGRRYCNRFVVIGSALAILLLIFPDELLPIATGFLGRDSTLTGRTDIWPAMVSLVKNPVIGFGFGSFWLGERLEHLWSLNTWRMNEAHNGFLEVYLDLGWIGVILLVAVILSAFLTAQRVILRNWEEGAFRIAVIIILVLYNLTESSFVRAGQLTYFIFMLAAITVPIPFQQSKTGSASA